MIIMMMLVTQKMMKKRIIIIINKVMIKMLVLVYKIIEKVKKLKKRCYLISLTKRERKRNNH
jgi:hypothetical protein